MSISEPKLFSCFLIGAQSRLIQCGELLLQRGHDVRGVVTDDVDVEHWAKEKNLRLVKPGRNLVAQLEDKPFDYLFSVDNAIIIPQRIIELPRKYAINFHDAPLPKYAGVNAPNWALMNRENTYGVTWHIIVEKIDAGDILEQECFSIYDDDTALKLNLRCFEKSIACFSRLLDKLEQDTVKPIRQHLEDRSYVSFWQRPFAACVIDWTQAAVEIDALCRGLDFGPYRNPLGMPKLILGDRAVLVKKIKILESVYNGPPGTIIRIDDDGMHIATGTCDVVLKEALSFDGRALSPAEILKPSGLSEGDQLPVLTSEYTEWLSSVNSTLCKQEDYWVGRLNNFEPLDIAYVKAITDKNKGVQSHVSRLSLSEKTLTNAGDQILAATLLYLSRIGGKNSFDVYFRNTALQQMLSGVEAIFAPYKPMRIDVKPGQTFEDFSDMVQQDVDQGNTRGTYPRDIGLRYPILRKTLEHHGSRKPVVAIARVKTLTDVYLFDEASLLIVIPDEGETCLWYYDPDALNENDVKRMQAQFSVLWRDIEQNKPLESLSILPESDRETLFNRWHEIQRDEVNQISMPELPVHELFEANVIQTPDALAILSETERLTYRELNEKANQLAHYLIKSGIGPEVRVGLCVTRSSEMIIGLLGVLKAGGSYVPLDPDYPADRLAFMIQDAQTALLLTEEALTFRLAEFVPKVVCLDTDWPVIQQECDQNPSTGVRLDNLAYIIYTSGSTGLPKGVMIEHRSLMKYMVYGNQSFEIQPEDRVLQFASINFDVSAEEIYSTLTRGATLVLRTDEMLDYRTFLQKCQEFAITVIDLPTAYWHNLTHWLCENNETMPITLRLVIIGGEEALLERVKNWRIQVSDRIRLVNTYGPTESTIVATMCDIAGPRVAETMTGYVPIGKPIHGIRSYILDQNSQPVPIGVPGELHIGGDGLARGYVNHPELTMEKFIPDLFSGKPKAQLYKTGDLVRHLPDGQIEFLGRIDHQVKVRGFRIELGEIESLLNQKTEIVQCIVTARDDAFGDKRLIAYLVLKPETAFDMEVLRLFLKEKLPEYMVPSAFVLLDQLPMSPNGKVDHKALPLPSRADQSLKRDIADARDPLEKQVKAIWEQVLDMAPIGVLDNFFDIGGHSILAVQLFNEIESKIGKRLPLSTLLQAPTIEALANILRPMHTDVAITSALMPIQPYGIKPPFFCVHGHFGNVLNFVELARYLGDEQPFYGLQSVGLSEGERPFTRIEAMASHYLKEIRNIQPEGPYYLGGFCFGGLVALEMAHQLRTQGQDVAQLCMFDVVPRGMPYLTSSDALKRYNTYASKQRVENHSEELTHFNARQKIGYLLKGVGRKVRDWTLNNAWMIFDRICTMLGRALPRPFHAVKRANTVALRTYTPRPYPGAVTLFLSKKVTLGYSDAPQADWAGIATGDVTIHLMDDDGVIMGGGMFKEPCVQSLAEHLTTYLAEARAEEIILAAETNEEIRS